MTQKEKPLKVKSAPNSKESEMMVLGCMLTSINSLNIAADALEETDFFFKEHKTIFASLKEAYQKDQPADIHIVAEFLKRDGKLEEVGSIGYLTTLAQYAGTSAYIEEYVKLVKDKSVLRQMIYVSQEIEKESLREPQDVSVLLDEAQAKFFQISQATTSDQAVLLKELLSGSKSESKLPYLKELQERQEQYQVKGPKESLVTGVPTHFVDLDKLINGMNNSNLIILASRPAMGKTALALNIAENVCFRDQMPVGIFSLEMSAEQLLHRIICSQSEVESDKIRTGALNGSDYQRIVSCVNEMQKRTMIIDDQPGIKITDLRARARRMKEAYDIRLLIIDYLQLLSGSGTMRSIENRQNEISEISRLLKNLARELNIPVFCLSQLSRRVEERQGHRPMMSDLRESGCVTGDTQIKDAKTGKTYTIKELAERKTQTPITVYAIDKDLKIKKRKLTKAFYSGKKEVFELKTKSGRSIKASANHPFLKLEGWTRLDQLKIKDKIALPRSLSPTQKKNLCDDELILLAHLLGDGCILPNQPYHYTSADKENLSIVKDAAKTLFGIDGKLVAQGNWSHLYLSSPIHLTKNIKHPITHWFEKLEIERVRSYEKKIPQVLLESPESDISLFLKHLWATDGNISKKIMKNRSPSAAIYYASSSKTLSEQVQHLLLCLNIQSTLRIQKSAKGYRDMHHVAIQGAENQTLFLEKVGCVGQKAKQIPLLLSFLKKIKTNLNNDIIPKEAWTTIVNDAKNQCDMSWRQICEQLPVSYCGSTLFKSGISRARMAKLHNILKNESLLQLAQSDVYWDEILSIRKLGIEDVYDATVDDVHNFVANDIFIHNSIEQDSDIVMFLLRREYYDPYDKPGQAELIIAKNRHGGVGSVALTFRKELAQFANFTPANIKANEEAFSAFSPSE